MQMSYRRPCEGISTASRDNGKLWNVVSSDKLVRIEGFVFSRSVTISSTDINKEKLFWSCLWLVI